jgi:hypothetical protein
MSKNRPTFETKIGRIRGTVWKNESDGGAFYNVSFSRLYKDEGGQWKDAATFSRDDLPLVAKVADRVHDWIFEANKADNAGEESREVA